MHRLKKCAYEELAALCPCCVLGWLESVWQLPSLGVHMMKSRFCSVEIGVCVDCG